MSRPEAKSVPIDGVAVLGPASAVNRPCELSLDNAFLGLYAPDSAQRAGIDHFCFGIEQYDPSTALTKLKAAVPSAQPTLENGDQIYVRDPDGVRVQFADVKYKR